MAAGALFVLKGTGVPVTLSPLFSWIRHARRFETTNSLGVQNSVSSAPGTTGEGVTTAVSRAPSTVPAGVVSPPVGTSQPLSAKIQNRIAAVNSSPRDFTANLSQDPVLKTGPSNAVKQILKGRDWFEPQEAVIYERRWPKLLILFGIAALAALLAFGL